jgi:hypothetical protein
MLDSTDAGLFPLPLVPFEDYMLTDDCAEYPADFFVRLRFAGVVERPSLEVAAETALQRHPLLRALVREPRPCRPEWVPAAQPQPPIVWHAGEMPAVSPARLHIDLRRQIGVRIHVIKRGQQTEMLLQFHHACCDGLGAMRFVEDLLGAYHNRVSPGGERMSLRPLDPQRLRRRGTFGMTPLRYLLRPHAELLGLLGSAEYFLRRPVPLATSNASGGELIAGEFPALCAHTFTGPETERLSAAAAEWGGTFNDLLLRRLFLAISAWNVDHAPHLRNRCR